jgi:nitroreductase
MPQSVQDGMAEAITGAYKDRTQSERDEAVLSAGMAAQTLMLAAKSLGYDSCPMRGMDFDKVAEIVKLPADHVLCMIVAVGKASEPPHPRSGPLPLEEILHSNSF